MHACMGGCVRDCVHACLHSEVLYVDMRGCLYVRLHICADPHGSRGSFFSVSNYFFSLMSYPSFANNPPLHSNSSLCSLYGLYVTPKV